MLAEGGSAFDSVDGAEHGDDPVIFGGAKFVSADLTVLRRVPFWDERRRERVVALRVFAELTRQGEDLPPAHPSAPGKLFELDR